MEITKELIHGIEKIFDKGLQDTYLTRSLGKILEYELGKTAANIQALKEDLSQFESKYKLSSEKFNERFAKGELGDNEDYFEWSALFQMYKRSVERFEILGGTSN